MCIALRFVAHSPRSEGPGYVTNCTFKESLLMEILKMDLISFEGKLDLIKRQENESHWTNYQFGG